ncbi:hypothetical protein HNR42_001358 [Deinobacterium chartae]|uniref:Porin n=1 Tax=Deinobacterium chartae TaxID=521158 RepID=A0A841I1W5_9DEIO|nr:hypothetical protein [Deinobacterium chartae]MBB6097935.1 hypothetical protein [Deinobacterium chartae]
MKKILAAAALALCGTAHATTLETSAGFSGSGLLLGVGIRDVLITPDIDFRAALTESNLEFGVGRTILGGPLGAARFDLSLRSAFVGGLRMDAAASGTLGSVALTGRLEAWNTFNNRFDPALTLGLDPASLNERGFRATLNGRYRISRDLILAATARAGSESSLAAQLALPRGDTDYRVGALVAQGPRAMVVGVTGGITLRPSETLNIAVDGMLGTQAGEGTYGLTASVGLFGLEALGNTDLRAYAALEPWRASAHPARFGVESSTPLGPGTLIGDLRAGGDNLIVRATYRLSF